MPITQQQIDRENATFWNELCGSQLARELGVTDHGKESLARFDSGFLQLYPYLMPLIQPERMRGKRVLEIGLGHGTVAQKLAEAGAEYTGMDIAHGPVEHVSWRLRHAELPGRAVQGSALQLPFPDGSFDFLVSIGCFHHTGNVQRCFDETFRVLRPGGVAVLMVYNKFSFRQWKSWPLRTLWAWLRGSADLSERQRAQYDVNRSGQAAPETVLLSIGELKRMLWRFESVSFSKQNADPLSIRGKVLLRREKLLGTLGRWLGLDVYVEARKAHDPQGDALGYPVAPLRGSCLSPRSDANADARARPGHQT